jgi:hypothetical protein
MAYPEFEPGVRRILCEKFPYKVIYTIEVDTLFVLAIYHTSRDPSRWREHD